MREEGRSSLIWRVSEFRFQIPDFAFARLLTLWKIPGRGVHDTSSRSEGSAGLHPRRRPCETYKMYDGDMLHPATVLYRLS